MNDWEFDVVVVLFCLLIGAAALLAVAQSDSRSVDGVVMPFVECE